ncbi:MAG: hypothetical protein AUF76_19830 [Acidobacteria bacterium 13_1_20CM_2_65_9]|nr:MAG: hypothetical protein AUF76_19830 [Acidobacteria bacterium 13_1_20CM_2_65_9]
MPIYLAPDVEDPCVTPQLSKARAREIATLFHGHGIPRDAPTLLALLRLTWTMAVDVAFERRQPWSIANVRPTPSGRVLPTSLGI